MDRIDEAKFGGLVDLIDAKYTVPGVLFSQIDSYRFKPALDHDASKPLVQYVLFYAVVIQGSIDINVNHKTVHCTSTNNNLIEFRATNVIYEMNVSDDFRGYILALTRSFIINNMGFMGVVGRSGSFFSSDNVSHTITFQDKQVIIDSLTRVERNMLRAGHLFFHETIYLSVIEAMLELVNIITEKGYKRSEGERSARRDELCHGFMNLLTEHGRREHSVSFYADKLCITSQYLTKVVKKELNMSANKLITINLVTESTKMLRMPGVSIAEIVDELGFSDQASFTKFFTRHTGTSPARYRRSNV